MRRLFVRIYGALFGVLLLSITAVVLLVPRQETPGLAQQIEHLTGLSPEQIRQRADGSDAATLAGELGIPVAFMPHEAVVGSAGSFARRNVAQGDPFVQLHDSGPAIYVPLRAGSLVAELRPPPPPPPLLPPGRLVLFAVLIAGGIGGAVFLSIRPVERQLQSIAGAASAIRGGELGARAPVVRDDAAGQLAEAFNRMAARIQVIVEGRRELLHGVSHELRTPLARLRFAAELLETADERADRRRRVDEMLGDVAELEELVAELLRYSQLEGDGGLQTEEVELTSLVADLVDEARRLRPECEVQSALLPVPLLDLDRRLVVRSIGNLVNNAVRYADRRVQVTVEVLGSDVEVRVEDDGPGVAPADRERIFEPFARLDAARSRDEGGVGLGLALARKAVVAHGGSIAVEGSELGGARFRWRVPAPARRSGTFARLTGSLRVR